MLLVSIQRAALICSLVCAPVALYSQENPRKTKFDQIRWERPEIARLGNIAEIKLPAGCVFADQENTRLLLEATENIVGGNELGAVASPKGNWFVIFEFDEVGYVKDDEKDKLDADRLLKSLQKNTERANEVRRSRGWDTMTITGWVNPPHYDSATHNLEWAFEGHDGSGSRVVNHKTRLLGRRGVMSAVLVVAPDLFGASMPDYRLLTGGFSFTPDNVYSAFRKGDKVAEYGLTALVLGGAAAAAAKTGLLKGLFKLLIAGWKLVLIALIALAGLIKRLLSGFGSGQRTGVEA